MENTRSNPTNKMSDKERILSALVRRIYIDAMYGDNSAKKWREIQPSLFYTSNETPLLPGDLVIASTTVTPNEFSVGFVDEVIDNTTTVIREIGTDRLCKYSNEQFLRIDTSIIGYEILEGIQYELYKKAREAFSYTVLHRFCNISFTENVCILSGRKMFETQPSITVQFEYDINTSVEYIAELLVAEEKKINQIHYKGKKANE